MVFSSMGVTLNVRMHDLSLSLCDRFSGYETVSLVSVVATLLLSCAALHIVALVLGAATTLSCLTPRRIFLLRMVSV